VRERVLLLQAFALRRLDRLLRLLMPPQLVPDVASAPLRRCRTTVQHWRLWAETKRLLRILLQGVLLPSRSWGVHIGAKSSFFFEVKIEIAASTVLLT
jgi:hypothetical protein